MSKDRHKFPTYTRDTAAAMTQEATTFVSDLVWNNRDFMTLFTADYGHVNQELARIYGVIMRPRRNSIAHVSSRV